MLAQPHRLRRRADFQDVIRNGRRCGSRLAVVYAAAVNRGADQTGTAVWQGGVVVSKAVGNSVVRHRVARRLRAIMAAELPNLEEPKRVVVRALGPAASADYRELERAVGRCVREAAK
ncbi:MAG: ribonuclease P protein component [Bifidobacteriaceae bacterium]|nr:ribonuclease P protein component [Bifidobacteriaceae bacterium]